MCQSFSKQGLGKIEGKYRADEGKRSPYRYERLMELLNDNGKNTVQKPLIFYAIKKGLHNADIGMGNEKAINQLIAHHSIVFEPKKLLVWVSTSPWQLGEYSGL